METPLDITDLEPAELEAALSAVGAEPFHARQIYRWIYRRGVTDFAAMTDLSQALRQQLAERFVVITPAVRRTQRSTDGTVKLLLGLADGTEIEAVFIPDSPGQTFCISTQVGCAMQCGFCLTGKMGLIRNLTAGEIAAQVRLLAHTLGLAGQAFNIVLMGMGEPLHNYDPTMKALRILTAAAGFNVPPRRITLSTVGVLPALEAAGDRADDAEPGGVAPCDHRGDARSARPGQPEVRPGRPDRCVPALSDQATPADHLRVCAAPRRQ